MLENINDDISNGRKVGYSSSSVEERRQSEFFRPKKVQYPYVVKLVTIRLPYIDQKYSSKKGTIPLCRRICHGKGTVYRSEMFSPKKGTVPPSHRSRHDKGVYSDGYRHLTVPEIP